MQIYKNPIILQDYSDPDAIRVNDDFFMVASSFNHTPVVPILHSKNLVDWRIINYVADKLPFDIYDNVVHGAAAWAPSIRYHNNTYYCVIPFPDEGVFVSTSNDPYGKWSDLHCLIKGKGIIDPCPIWVDDKCYMVVGFAKSRIGFNSCLGIYEVSNDLKTQITDYKIIYDGHDQNPTIEGPKFNTRNGYYYIMAPAGSVKAGWQVALRSKDIYGPYQSKIVLMQNDSPINGPHQGALIEIDDNDNWAFLHFQDMRCYGRVVYLQPVKWINDWPICGAVGDELLAGTPYIEHPYIIDIKSDYKLNNNDEFMDSKLSLIWQTPANKKDNWYKLDNGLILNCVYHNEDSIDSLNLTPNLFLQKLCYLNFKASVEVKLNLINDGDEVGFTLMGEEYGYICIKRINGKNFLNLYNGKFKEIDRLVSSIIYKENNIKFNIKYKYPNKFNLGYNDIYFKETFIAKPGRWIGSKIGIYAKGLKNSLGSAKFNNFLVKKVGK